VDRDNYITLKEEGKKGNEKILKEEINQTVYEKLKKIARAKKTITYSKLGEMIGFGGHDPRLWQILAKICRYEHQQDRPMLSAVVNIHEKNRPGKGFFKVARQLGVHQGKSDAEFFKNELCRVYDYWFSHSKSFHRI